MTETQYFIRYRDTATTEPFEVYGGVDDDYMPLLRFSREEAREVVVGMIDEPDNPKTMHYRIQPVELISLTDPRIEDFYFEEAKDGS